MDGREITVSFDSIISPKTRKVIANEGMPIVKDDPYGED